MKQEKITLTKAKSRLASIPLTWFFAILLLAGVMVNGFRAVAEGVSAGFFYDHFRLTLEDGSRTEAAGPFYYSLVTDTQNGWAIPPFYSVQRDPGVDREEYDVLYPILTSTRYGSERRWQFFQLFSTSHGLQPDESKVSQFTIFPLYFYQRAADTNLDYTCVVPFYGRIKNRLFRDEIYMVLFPFYVETRKRDVVTDNYFFPFVDVHHGNGLDGWQFWPFVGHEHKDITSQTNGFGDVSLVPGHDHSFYMWLFYLSQDNGIGTDNPEKFRASLPFYSLERSPARDSTTILWPFFTTIDDRARKYREWQEPWPFIIFARGEGKHTSRIFPFFSESHNDTRETDSYLWPIYVYSRYHSGILDQQRTRVVYWLYDRLSQKNTETGQERLRVDMWPFFTWHHEPNNDERLQILAPVEALVPDNPGIERNWSPLWSLWRSENNAKTGANSQSFLWNLYRREVAGEHKKVSALFGLYQYEAQPDEKTLRLFYIPVNRSHAQ